MPPTPGSIPPSPDSPQYVHEGLSRRLRVPGHRQGRDGQPDPLVQGPRDVDRRPCPGGGGEDRTGSRRSSRVSAGNFGQGVAYAARALGVPAVIFASRNANRGKVERMRALGADGHRRSGRTSTRPAARREAYAAEHDAELLVDGDDPRISTGAATLALELTDAVEAGDLPAPGGHRRAGRATARSSTASVPGSGRRCPTCRVVGIQAEARRGDDPELAGRSADRHRRPPRPTPTASRRGSPSRARSS